MSWQKHIKTKEDLLRALSSAKITDKIPIPEIFERGKEKIKLGELIHKYENRENISKKDLDFLRKIWYAIENKIDVFIGKIKVGSIDINSAIKEIEYYGGLKRAHRRLGEILWTSEKEIRAQKRKKEFRLKKRKWRINQKRRMREW